jgi:hypothetical protein
MSLAPDDGRAVQSGAALDAAAEGSSQGPGAGSCDYEACARFYHSFRAADCTYQPFDGGPRQLCEK